MYKKSKRISVIVILALLLVAFTISVSGSSVTYEGHEKGFAFSPGSEYSKTDLFSSFKNCMPGETLTERITVSNNSDDSDYVKIYVRAVSHDELTNPLSKTVSDSKETVASMNEFLSKLNMKVYNGDELIFDASPDETAGMSENVLIGTLRKGEITDLFVDLAIPTDLGNEYASSIGEVDWVFTTEGFDDPLPPTTGTLIQTGGADMPVTVMLALGTVIIVIGVFLVVKKGNVITEC